MLEIAFFSAWIFIFAGFVVSKLYIDDADILSLFSDQPKLRRDGSDWGVYPETEP